jgi:hypothetical protein
MFTYKTCVFECSMGTLLLMWIISLLFCTYNCRLLTFRIVKNSSFNSSTSTPVLHCLISSPTPMNGTIFQTCTNIFLIWFELYMSLHVQRKWIMALCDCLLIRTKWHAENVCCEWNKCIIKLWLVLLDFH